MVLAGRQRRSRHQRGELLVVTVVAGEDRPVLAGAGVEVLVGIRVRRRGAAQSPSLWPPFSFKPVAGPLLHILSECPPMLGYPREMLPRCWVLGRCGFTPCRRRPCTIMRCFGCAAHHRMPPFIERLRPWPHGRSPHTRFSGVSLFPPQSSGREAGGTLAGISRSRQVHTSRTRLENARRE